MAYSHISVSDSGLARFHRRIERGCMVGCRFAALLLMHQPVIQIAIALLHREGKWLVARRAAHVHLPGVWEFPGGKIQEAESAAQAALRELLEECGVVGRAERELAPIQHSYPERRVQITPVL